MKIDERRGELQLWRGGDPGVNFFRYMRFGDPRNSGNGLIKC